MRPQVRMAGMGAEESGVHVWVNAARPRSPPQQWPNPTPGKAWAPHPLQTQADTTLTPA